MEAKKNTIETIIKMLREVCSNDTMYNINDVYVWIKDCTMQEIAEVICGSHNLLLMILRALEDMEVVD